MRWAGCSQVNDQVLLDVTKRDGRGQPPVIITSVCVEQESHRVVLRPDFDRIQTEIGSGGLRNLFDYYSDLRTPTPPGAVLNLPDDITFDNLEQFAFDRARFERSLKQALLSVAKERCPAKPRRLIFTIDGESEGRITVHRLFCVVEIDLYVAVNLRSLMDSDDYDDFIESIVEELRQTGKTYASQEATVRRGGSATRDFPIVRRAGLDRYIAYLKVGIGSYVFQSGWDVDDGRERCKKKRRRRKAIDRTFQPRYETVPRRPEEPKKLKKPDFKEPRDRRAAIGSGPRCCPVTANRVFLTSRRQSIGFDQQVGETADLTTPPEPGSLEVTPLLPVLHCR